MTRDAGARFPVRAELTRVALFAFRPHWPSFQLLHAFPACSATTSIPPPLSLRRRKSLSQSDSQQRPIERRDHSDHHAPYLSAVTPRSTPTTPKKPVRLWRSDDPVSQPIRDLKGQTAQAKSFRCVLQYNNLVMHKTMPLSHLQGRVRVLAYYRFPS